MELGFGFISLGWARLEPARARQELSSLFLGQWSSGRVPQIVFNSEADPDAYFPRLLAGIGTCTRTATSVVPGW